LVYGKETVGLITLDHDQPGFYTEANKDLLTPFCSQAAMAIYNAYLLADLQRQVKGHQALNKVGTELAGMLNEEEILAKVTRAAADAFDCTHCSVFRLEE
jgi:GAF domain-containing protein